MAQKLSRRKLAEYAASELGSSHGDVIQSLAAYLVVQRRTRELPLIIRDIEAELARRGTIDAHVYSASRLSTSLKKAVESFIAAQYIGASVSIKETVDPSLIGGVIIQTPDAEFDSSIRSQLTQLASLTTNLKTQ